MLFGEFLFLPIALTDCFCMFELCPCFQLLKFYDGQNLLLNAIGYLIILCTGLCLQEITCMICVRMKRSGAMTLLQKDQNTKHKKWGILCRMQHVCYKTASRERTNEGIHLGLGSIQSAVLSMHSFRGLYLCILDQKIQQSFCIKLIFFPSNQFFKKL